MSTRDIDFSRDYYADLDLPSTADAVEIKKKYKTLALLCHPDRNHGNEAEANVKFLKIQSAAEILTDPTKKATYDQHRQPARTTYSGASGVRGNPWSNVSTNFPPPPTRKKPPPSKGASRYEKFTPPERSAYQASQEGAQARKNNYEAYVNLKHGTPRADTGRTGRAPQPPPRNTAHSGGEGRFSGRDEPSPRKQPRPPTAFDEFQEANASPHRRSQSGGSRPQSGNAPPPVPKRNGFMPNTPGAGDEPPAPRGAYFTQRDKPAAPPPPPRDTRDPTRPTTRDTRDTRDSRDSTRYAAPDPLKRFREQVDDDELGLSTGPRISTPYATHGGEKFNPFESTNMNRSKSTREARETTPEMVRGTRDKFANMKIPRGGSDPNLKSSPRRARSFADRPSARRPQFSPTAADDSDSDELTQSFARSSMRPNNATPTRKTKQTSGTKTSANNTASPSTAQSAAKTDDNGNMYAKSPSSPTRHFSNSSNSSARNQHSGQPGDTSHVPSLRASAVSPRKYRQYSKRETQSKVYPSGNSSFYSSHSFEHDQGNILNTVVGKSNSIGSESRRQSEITNPDTAMDLDPPTLRTQRKTSKDSGATPIDSVFSSSAPAGSKQPGSNNATFVQGTQRRQTNDQTSPQLQDTTPSPSSRKYGSYANVSRQNAKLPPYVVPSSTIPEQAHKAPPNTPTQRQASSTGPFLESKRRSRLASNPAPTTPVNGTKTTTRTNVAQGSDRTINAKKAKASKGSIHITSTAYGESVTETDCPRLNNTRTFLFANNSLGLAEQSTPKRSGNMRGSVSEETPSKRAKLPQSELQSLPNDDSRPFGNGYEQSSGAACSKSLMDSSARPSANGGAQSLRNGDDKPSPNGFTQALNALNLSSSTNNAAESSNQQIQMPSDKISNGVRINKVDQGKKNITMKIPPATTEQIAARGTYWREKGYLSPANTTRTRFTFNIEPDTFAANPRPAATGFSNSAENISTAFSSDDWNGQFKAGASNPFAPESSNVARPRTMSASRGRPRSPTKPKAWNPLPQQTESPGGTKFDPTQWAEHFSSNTFMPPPNAPATQASVPRPLQRRTGSIRTPMGTNTPMAGESSNATFSTPNATVNQNTVETPEPMDIDTPPVSNTDTNSNTAPIFSADRLHIDPSRVKHASNSTAADASTLHTNLEAMNITDTILSLDLDTPPVWTTSFEKYMADYTLWEASVLRHLFGRHNELKEFKIGGGEEEWSEHVRKEREDAVVLKWWGEAKEEHLKIVGRRK